LREGKGREGKGREGCAAKAIIIEMDALHAPGLPHKRDTII